MNQSETPDQKTKRARAIISILKKATQKMAPPAGQEVIQEFGKNPFLILVSCILSLRTKDTVSLPASRRLFKKALTPQELLQLSLPQIQTLIYPVGFYRQKARQLHALSVQLPSLLGASCPAVRLSCSLCPALGAKP